MNRATQLSLAAAIALLGTAASSAMATTINAIGQDGWYADDTRSATGVNLVGSTLTHYGKPGQTPTAGDDTTIGSMLYFADQIGSDGAAIFDKTSVSGGFSKVSLSKINTSGFATSAGGSSWADSFTAQYRYYTSTPAETTILKIGVKSTAYANSQIGFTAARTGESPWDLILVHKLDTPTAGAWVDTGLLDKDNGKWWLFDQATNTYFDSTGAGLLGTIPNGKTLSEWSSTALGSYLFGDGASVTSVQLGLGSSTANVTSAIDYLSTSLINAGETTNFVPEPASLGLLGVAAMGLLARRRNA